MQVWGAFAYVEGGLAQASAASPARRGYLYFRLDPSATAAQRETVRTEWLDLEAVADKSQAVGFGSDQGNHAAIVKQLKEAFVAR